MEPPPKTLNVCLTMTRPGVPNFVACHQQAGCRLPIWNVHWYSLCQNCSSLPKPSCKTGGSLIGCPFILGSQHGTQDWKLRTPQLNAKGRSCKRCRPLVAQGPWCVESTRPKIQLCKGCQGRFTKPRLPIA